MRALTPPNSMKRICVSLRAGKGGEGGGSTTIGRILTLEKHQPHADMRTLPTPFAETVQIALDMQHSTTSVTSILAIWVSHNAHFVTIGDLGSNLNPFSDHTLVSGIETS